MINMDRWTDVHTVHFLSFFADTAVFISLLKPTITQTCACKGYNSSISKGLYLSKLATSMFCLNSRTKVFVSLNVVFHSQGHMNSIMCKLMTTSKNPAY